MFLPSQHLPRLRSKPALHSVNAALQLLTGALGAQEEQLISFGPADARLESDDDLCGPSASEVEFEMRYARDWLCRFVSRGMEWLSEEEEDSAVAAVDQAAKLLAICAGKSASGPSTITYEFPSPEPLSSPLTTVDDRKTAATRVRIRDATLMADALGGRTWGAAPLLTQELLKRHISEGVSILELGAGTGLVGLALAVDRKQRFPDSSNECPVILTDYHPHVLQNLQHNLTTQKDRLHATEVRTLDWQKVYESNSPQSPARYQSTAQTVPDADRLGAVHSRSEEWRKELDIDSCFSLIVAADCIYDPIHPIWIRSVAMRHLKRPDGILHILSPLRDTHREEIRKVYEAFSCSSAGALTLLRETDLEGYDDFGPPRLKLDVSMESYASPQARTMRPKGTLNTYRWFEVGWSADDFTPQPLSSVNQ